MSSPKRGSPKALRNNNEMLSQNVLHSASHRINSARVYTNPMNGGNDSKASRISLSADKAHTVRGKNFLGSQPHTGSTQNFVTFGINNA